MKILVCVDLSKSTEIIVDKIEELSKPLSARVWLLHNAVPEPDKIEFKVDPIAARESLAKKFHVEHLEIQKLAERLRKAGVETTALLVHGKTLDVILKEAADLDVDMIAVGSHGRGAMYQLLVGSISEDVLHRSRLPVLVIPTRKHG
ncbi:MAG: universal stress protein [Gammaproteobacteria bacterium]|nr:universal stress protein [Gammaproteobacteria bacterium]MDJ0873158.1 universal stress protein [Gammaproteobacteria bacterium]